MCRAFDIIIMAATTDPREPALSCSDFSLFQDILKSMRKMDDQIVHSLNTSIPTDSFASKVDASRQCQDLFKQMMTAHQQRETVIKECIKQASEAVEDAKSKKSGDPNDVHLRLLLKKEQTRLRLIQSELNVEEVVNERSKKIFQERCRLHYKPPL